MAEPDRVRLAGLLDEARAALASDNGAAIFLPDADGVMRTVVSSGFDGTGSAWYRRLLRRTTVDPHVLVVPIPDSDGGIVVLERTTGDYGDQDLALAQAYSRQMSRHTGRANGPGRNVWARQVEAIQRISAQLTRLASVEDLAGAICRETRHVINYDEAHVLLVGDEGPYPVAAVCGEPGSDRSRASILAGDQTPLSELIARVLGGGAPAVEAELVEPGPGRTGRWSVLAVPMVYEHRVNGVICLLEQGTARFAHDDVRLLQILADQAAVAVENARLLAGRDELVHELNGLLDLSMAANEPTDARSMAGLLAAKMRAISRMDGCIISRLQDEMLWVLGSDHVAVAPVWEIADYPVRAAVLREGRAYVLRIDEHGASARPVEGKGDEDGVSLGTSERASLLELGARTAILIPLSMAGRHTGLVELISTEERRTFGPVEMQAYRTMAASVAAGLENVRLLEELRMAADIDQVTAVHNHRYLQERLQQEVARAARSRRPICVLMLDLDHFKPINDRHGHAEGDRVLRSVAETIRGCVRTADIVARYGGDEFVIVMPDTTATGGQEVASRVVNGLLARGHEISRGTTVMVRASAGIAVYPEDGRTAAALLAAADAAMYESKRAGQADPHAAPSVELVEAAAAPGG